MGAKVAKIINLEALLRSSILVGFACFFFWIIRSGKVGMYVNPRLVPWIVGAMIAMVLMALITASDIFKPQPQANRLFYLFFLVPLLMAFTIPVQSMDAMPSDSKNITIAQPAPTQNKNLVTVDQADPTNNGDAMTTDNPPNGDPNSANSYDSQEVDNGLKMIDNTIVLNDDNFAKWIEQIYENKNAYDGKKIELEGFVYKNLMIHTNEFVPARLVMVCCAADLQTVGLLCRYDKTTQLKRTSWVKVSGVIKVVDYCGQKTPIIYADKVVSIAKPENEYIYP